MTSFLDVRIFVVIVQSISHVQRFATPWTAALQASLSSLSPRVCSNSCPLSISKHFILCCPLFLLPSIFPTIRVFSNESALHIRWPKGLSKSLLLHHNLKVSILWSSVFFMVQHPHPYTTTGKTIALTVWTLVNKVMSLLFNTLSRFNTL